MVVTNPTHYAVAMKYEDGMGAPKVLAKGKLRTAERIIELAKEHKITIMRAPPFARALYHNTEIGQEIPHQLYTAAAQILAYVFQLKHYNAHGGMAPVYRMTCRCRASLTRKQDPARYFANPEIMIDAGWINFPNS